MPVAHPQELPRGHARRRADLRRRGADRPDQEGPGARAGGQRRDAARHPEGEPGDARHPLGLRLLHRRGRRDRPRAGGRHLPRRRRLRHQLRRPPAPLGPVVGRGQAPHPAARRPALPRHPDRRRPERQVHLRQAQAQEAHGTGVGLRRQPGVGHPPRPRVHRGRRPARRRRPRPRQRPRHRARLRPVRHARLGQPLPRSPGRRPRHRRRGGRRNGPARGADHRPDPLGLARPGLSGLRRLPRRLQGRAQEVRLHAPRLATGLRPRRAPRGRRTSAPCARRPTSPGATASS